MAFVHRPKVLSAAEARTQKKVGGVRVNLHRLSCVGHMQVLQQRSAELIRIGEDLASRQIDFNDEVSHRHVPALALQ